MYRRCHNQRVLLALLAGLTASAGAAAAAAKEPWRPQYVTPEGVKRWMAQGEPVTLVDVRQPEEFAKAHLAGAVNISDESRQADIDALSRRQPIVVYSTQSRYRAPAAARMLMARGFTNVYVLEGGLVAWQTADRPAPEAPPHLALSAPDAPPSVP